MSARSRPARGGGQTWSARASGRADRYLRIYAVVRRIPPGRVTTYGGVAMLAGYTRAARFVGLAMHHCKDPTVPCHRVVNASGRLAPGFLTQRSRLEREGVRFSGPNVDLARYLWRARLPAPRRRGVA